MQNKANFKKSQMSLSSYILRDYGDKSDWTLSKNKPNSKPIKANLSQSFDFAQDGPKPIFLR